MMVFSYGNFDTYCCIFVVFYFGRYQGQPLGSRKQLHPLLEREAKACDGCASHDPDDPFAPVSVHIPFKRREDDFREDWLRERMYGRLPYDKYARLVVRY